MRAHRALLVGAVAGLLLGGLGARAQSAAPGVTPVFGALDQAVQQLYGNTQNGFIRVTVTQSPAAVLDDDLRKKFEVWRTTDAAAGRRGPGANDTGGSRGESAGGRGDAGSGGGRGMRVPPSTNPASGNQQGGQGFGGRGGGFGQAGGGGIASQVGAFLRSEADRLEKQASPTARDKLEAARLRGLAVKVEVYRNGFQGDASAIVFDDAGHALLLTGLLRESHKDPLAVTLPNGATTTASFVGANFYGGYTVLKLANKQGVKPVPLAGKKLMPGQLMMMVTAGQGAASLMLATPRPGSTGPLEDNLATTVDERSGAFLFDSAGDAVALISGGAGFQGERRTYSGSRMSRDVAYIISREQDIEPRALGLEFAADKAHPGAVVVTSVTPKSLADGAGLLANDVLVSIDRRPVSELAGADGRPLPGLLQLQLDLATRTGNVPVEIIRGDKKQTLQMPLGK